MSLWFMVYTYNELVTGANLNQLITGGPHIGPYIFGLFFRPIFKGISLQHMVKHMVYLHFWILEFQIPIDQMVVS